MGHGLGGLWGERPSPAQGPAGAAPRGGEALAPNPAGSGAPSARTEGKFGAARWPGFSQLLLLSPCPLCSWLGNPALKAKGKKCEWPERERVLLGELWQLNLPSRLGNAVLNGLS